MGKRLRVRLWSRATLVVGAVMLLAYCQTTPEPEPEPEPEVAVQTEPEPEPEPEPESEPESKY